MDKKRELIKVPYEILSQQFEYSSNEVSKNEYRTNYNKLRSKKQMKYVVKMFREYIGLILLVMVTVIMFSVYTNRIAEINAQEEIRINENR